MANATRAAETEAGLLLKLASVVRRRVYPRYFSRLARRAVVTGLALPFLLVALAPVRGNETIADTYDARGRLTHVAHSGTVNSGVSADYGYDKADNRSNVTVTVPSAPSFALNDVSVTKGGTLNLTVTKTRATSSSFTVNYATANNTAASSSDYNATSGTLTLAAADTTTSVIVTTLNGSSAEGTETLYVNLSSPSGGATISNSRGVGTINDNDTPCGLTFLAV